MTEGYNSKPLPDRSQQAQISRKQWRKKLAALWRRAGYVINGYSEKPLGTKRTPFDNTDVAEKKK